MRIEIDPDLPATLRDASARALAGELRPIPGVTVTPAGGGAPAPDGAKSPELLALGTLAVTLPSAATLRVVAQVVVAWLGRAKARKVTFQDGDRKIVIEAPNAADQRAAVELILRELTRDGHGHTDRPAAAGERA